MSKPSAIETERIKHINFLMAEFHDSNNEMYEGLMDRDFDYVNKVIDQKMSRLTQLKNSINEEL
tara:strand:+ start:1518 stop:1709 length:192 start_codon:yes stop_codon:yes gene_type:complete